METLLQKALKVKKGHHRTLKYNSEEVELALAWLEDEITFTQVTIVINKTGSNLYNFLAQALRKAYQKGKLKVK